MKLIRYQTSPLFTPSRYPTLRDEMDRLFDIAFPALSSIQLRGLYNDRQGQFPVDLYEDKKAVTVRAELPGFHKEDVAVQVEDDVLTVTAVQKMETKPDQKDNAATPERQFSRAIALPENLDLDKIQAVYENGVLTVTLPKREEVKPKQIAVEIK